MEQTKYRQHSKSCLVKKNKISADFQHVDSFEAHSEPQTLELLIEY